ncbi:MAG: aminopeptidase P family protein [Candidatus Rokubacteria bacterium]|nr:aminopeptidase P family protein [Candidatus Rokubacteria bacterium]
MPDTGRPIIANVDRLHAFMDRHRLAGVVARSGQNFTYLSGLAYPGTLARHLDLPDSVRGVLLVWLRHGEPVIVLNKIAEGLTRRDSWVKRIEVYDAYTESPYGRLCRVLREAGLARERVGFEKTYVSAAHWEEVQRELPELQMVDCAPMMDEVRWVKTPGEIALLKQGADLLDDAYLEVFPTIKPGDTERAVHSRLIGSCLRRGANWVHGILNSSTNLIPYAGESGTVFRKGDVIRTDYVAYVQGYPGHQSRNAILGTPTAQQRREYDMTRDIYRMTIDRCRPGVRAGDVYEFVVEEFAKYGWTYTTSLVGHGVGCWWHQQEPVLARGSTVVLEDGMVLALEPHRDYWHLQDLVVVRARGPELISDKFSTDQMFVIE